MRKCKYLSFIFITILILGIYTKDIYSEGKRNILFISSGNPNFLNFDEYMSGIVSGLGHDINVQTEYMNSDYNYDQKHELEFYELLSHRLRNYKNFDGIIVESDDALEFAIKYREDLFKDIPIVFFAIENEELIKNALSYDMVSGVKEVSSIDKNIELISKFHKGVKNIYFMSGYKSELTKEDISYYENKYKKNNINLYEVVTRNIDVNDFKKKLKKLKSSDAIITFYPGYFENINLGHEDTIELIKSLTKDVPIYSSFEHSIGKGTIGGKVVSPYNQAKKAGEIVNSILSGKSDKKIYIGDDNANKYIFDYEVMKEFGIKKHDLPDGSVIVNDPIEIYKKHENYILVVISIILVLVAMVIALISYTNYKMKYEKELLRLIDEGEELSRLKAHFTSNISHELRTPITVISSVMQLSKSKSKNNEFIISNNNYEIIESNCNRLLRLINNLIDIQKFKCVDTKPYLQNVNIVELIEDITLSVIPYTKSKNLDIIFDTTDEEIITAVDIDKMERAILNLLSNAIKFSYNGGTLNVNVSTLEDNVEIEIKDKGIGMNEEELEHIFDIFYQIDNTMTRKNEGSGVGLSIVKLFVEAHGGKIDIKSKLNEGTTFKIKIPIIKISENRCDKYIIEDELKEKVKLELSDIYM